MKTFRSLTFWLILFFVAIIFYTLFSFSLTDPNLTLLKSETYWNFQQWMWHTFFENAQLLTKAYVGVVIALFCTHLGVTKLLPNRKISLEKNDLLNTVLSFLLIVSPLLISYNALSHDVFNYMFNAKMVAYYQADPHKKVALDFPQDDWLRFMHNTHTPAPYGYGWTYFSLLPYSVFQDKFLPTWLFFRAMSVLSIGVLFGAVVLLGQQLLKRSKHFADALNYRTLALVFLNPLFLIEVVSNAHNDLWMMAPAMLSLGIVMLRKKGFSRGLLLVASAALLAFSISVKFVTVGLLPIWLYYALNFEKNRWNGIFTQWWPTLASLFFLVPLLTDRSQQFHPWYLTWILVWLPFIRVKIWKYAVLVLSVSSLLRYIPWLLAGGFSDEILRQQKMMTWIPFLVFLAGYSMFFIIKRKVTVSRVK